MLAGHATGLFDGVIFKVSCIFSFFETTGFTGRTCDDTVTTGCSSSPCLSGSTCVTMGTEGHFRCQCLQGFTGFYCEVNIDDCVNVSCGELKVCVDAVNTYR